MNSPMHFCDRKKPDFDDSRVKKPGPIWSSKSEKISPKKILGAKLGIKVGLSDRGTKGVNR